jgi:hypothetical protein
MQKAVKKSLKDMYLSLSLSLSLKFIKTIPHKVIAKHLFNETKCGCIIIVLDH